MVSNNSNKYDLRDHFYDLLKTRPLANKIFFKLLQEGDILLFGGAVRSFLDNKFYVIPRDFDLVVNSNKMDFDHHFTDISYKKNSFGGYKLVVDGISLDIWSLGSTWAFKEKKVLEVTKENLPKTVFLNYDSIVYNLENGELYDEGYSKAKKDKLLDIVLEENPFPELNILRSFVFKKRENMVFSDALLTYVSEWSKVNHGNEIEILLRIQFKHYGRELISKYEIQKEFSVF